MNFRKKGEFVECCFDYFLFSGKYFKPFKFYLSADSYLTFLRLMIFSKYLESRNCRLFNNYQFPRKLYLQLSSL